MAVSLCCSDVTIITSMICCGCCCGGLSVNTSPSASCASPEDDGSAVAAIVTINNEKAIITVTATSENMKRNNGYFRKAVLFRNLSFLRNKSAFTIVFYTDSTFASGIFENKIAITKKISVCIRNGIKISRHHGVK